MFANVTIHSNHKSFVIMSQQFFGGNGKTLASVSRLPINSFAQLVDEILNVPVMINVTKKRYRKLAKDDQNQLKQVAFIVPCSFNKSTNCKRRTENAKDFSLICLDIDDSSVARAYYSDPITLEDQLEPFNFAIYETASSTPENPRVRVLVEADRLPIESYRLAASIIAKRIGMPSINKESKVVVQPMYLPSIFVGDDPDTDHPLLHFRKDGKAFTKKDLKEDDEEMPTERPNQNDTFVDALEFLKAPLDQITLEIAEQAIKHVDPDVKYDKWLEIAFALRHQFYGDLEDAAYELFDAWSAEGDKYEGQEDTKAKWESIKPHAQNRNPITIRTLLFKAQEGGWVGDGVIKKCFDSTRKWIMSTAKHERQLMAEGPIRIAGTPLLSPSEEESLINMLIDRCKKEFGCRVSMTTMKKELRDAKHKLYQRKQSKGDVQPWAKGLCFVAESNEFFRQSTGEKMSPESADNRYGRFLTGSVEDSEKEVLNNGDTLENARPVVRVRDYLLNVMRIPEVYTYAYDPRNPNDSRIFKKDGIKFINTYVRCYPEPDEKSKDEAGEVFVGHIKNLIAEPEYQKILLDFLAYHVQFPGHKIRWGILLQGVQGCGKTAIAQAMAAVLGERHVKSVDASVLLGSSFNDWAQGAQIVTLEEIRVAGKNRYEVMNKLKPAISNDRISINEKFRSLANIDNVSNYLMFTNHKDSLALTDEERRYFVLQSKIQTKGQIRELGNDYFKKFFHMLKTQSGGLRLFLEDWDIDDNFDADGHAPDTEYLHQLVEASAPNDVVLVRKILNDEENPLASAKIVCSSILDTIVELEGHGKIKPQRLSAILDEEGFYKFKRCRLGNESTRYTVFIHRDFADMAIELTYYADLFLKNEIDRKTFDLL